MGNSGSVLVKLGVGLLVLYTLGLVLFAATLPRTPARLPHADGIVALTGGDARLDAADMLLEKGAAKRLLISGVNSGTTKAQLKALAHGGRRFDCCADLGFRATSTHGNADEATAWVEYHGYNSIIVVTANYHMRRSLNEFSADMPGVRLLAYPVNPQGLDLDGWWRDPHALHLLNSEYAKYLASFVITHFVHNG
ncbi:MAG: YdcF family protein [Proteobacteria bacterium]|nr:YdcF family protein [Pseudomonadota bacterium]